MDLRDPHRSRRGDRAAPSPDAARRGGGYDRGMVPDGDNSRGAVLLAHGDDGYRIDRAVAEFAERMGATDRVVLAPERTPDESVIERAALEAASVGLFGSHCVVLRQPLRAAGTSASAAERLVTLVEQLPPGAILALAEMIATVAPPLMSRNAGSRLLRELAPTSNSGSPATICAPWSGPSRRSVTPWSHGKALVSRPAEHR